MPCESSQNVYRLPNVDLPACIEQIHARNGCEFPARLVFGLQGMHGFFYLAESLLRSASYTALRLRSQSCSALGSKRTRFPTRKLGMLPCLAILKTETL